MLIVDIRNEIKSEIIYNTRVAIPVDVSLLVSSFSGQNKKSESTGLVEDHRIKCQHTFSPIIMLQKIIQLHLNILS